MSRCQPVVPLQVLDEIVQMLTEPKYMNKMVVILAGYDQQVRCPEVIKCHVRWPVMNFLPMPTT